MKKIAAIFLVALLLRLGMVGVWYLAGHGSQLSYDTDGYYSIAKSLVEGKGFQLQGGPPARRPPLYPFFISLCLRLAPFPVGVQVAQALIGGMSCLLLFGIGKEMFGEKTGLLASGLMTLDYVSIRQTVSVLVETVFIFLLLASLYFLMKAQREGKKRWFVGAGVAGGLALLTKDVLVYYFPFVAFGLLFKNKSGKLGFSAAVTFLLSLFLVIAPWCLRNSLVYRRPVLITVISGQSFYSGNNPKTTVNPSSPNWIVGDDYFYPQDPNEPPLGSYEANRYYFKKGIEFIRSHPRRFLELAGRKVIKMWRPFYSDLPLFTQSLSALIYLPTMIFGLLGIFGSRNRWGEFYPILWLPVYLFLVHAVTIADVRYRYPAIPFLMVFAADAMLRTLSYRSARSAA